jgi:hypothetical protein
MIPRLTGLFLLVVVCLGVIGLWPEASHGPERERSWPTADLSGVDAIRVDGPAEHFELLRLSDGWRLRLPQVPELLRADRAAIAALAEFLRSHKPLGRLPGQGEGAQPAANFDPPRRRLAMSGSSPWELAIGAPREGLAGLPARLSFEPGGILLLPLEYEAHLDRPAEDYLDLRVFGSALDGPTALELAIGGHTLWAVRRAQAGWVFSGPPELAGQVADSDAVGAYVQNLRGLEVELPWPVSQPPDDLPRLTLTLGSGDASETLAVWPAPGGLGKCPARASWQPLAFSLDRAWVDQVEKTAFALRERSILALTPGRVERMRLAEGPRSIELARRDAAWIASAAAHNLVGVDVLLWRLSRLAFAAGPRPGLPEGVGPVLSWELFDARDRSLARLAFAPDPRLPAGLVWCADLASGSAYPVAEDLYRDAVGLLPGRPAAGTQSAS